MIPLPALQDQGLAYATTTSGTYDHLSSDTQCQYMVPADGFISIGILACYRRATATERELLDNGNNITVSMTAYAKSASGYNGSGWWNIYSYERVLTPADKDNETSGRALIQVKAGDTIAFARLWPYWYLPGYISIQYYPIKKKSWN